MSITISNYIAPVFLSLEVTKIRGAFFSLSQIQFFVCFVFSFMYLYYIQCKYQLFCKYSSKFTVWCRKHPTNKLFLQCSSQKRQKKYKETKLNLTIYSYSVQSFIMFRFHCNLLFCWCCCVVLTSQCLVATGKCRSYSMVYSYSYSYIQTNRLKKLFWVLFILFAVFVDLFPILPVVDWL